MIIFPIVFLLIEYFYHLNAIIDMIATVVWAITFLIVLFLYYKFTNFKLSKYYKKNFNFKLENQNIYCAFYRECLINKIDYSDFDVILDLLNLELEHNTNFNIKMNIFLPLISSYLVNYFSTFLKSPSNENTFIFVLLFTIYAFLYFIFNKEKLNKFNFRTCLVYAKHLYNLKNQKN